MLVAILGFVVIGPSLDRLVTDEKHDVWKLASLSLDENYYYFLGYQEHEDGSYELILGIMNKDEACLRPAVGGWPHYDEIEIYKFGLYVGAYDCLYL